MKSIRLSLIVYFLCLLALALGAVSAVVYETSHKSLMARETTARKQLRDRFQDRKAAEKDKLDKTLLRRVETLANLARTPWGRNRYQDLYFLGTLGSSLTQLGYLQFPVWLLEVSPGPLAFRINRTFAVKLVFDQDHARVVSALGQVFANPSGPNLALVSLRLDKAFHRPWPRGRRSMAPPPLTLNRFLFVDNLFPGNAEGQEAEYCQLTGEAGIIWQKSHSLVNRALPLSRAESNRLPLGKPTFRDWQLEPGVSLRVLTLKAPVPPWLFRFQLRRPEGGPGRKAFLGVGGWRFPGKPPYFILQFALPTRQRDAAIGQLQSELEKDLASLQNESETSLASLRGRLLWIGLVTFAATVLGGFLLIRLGLSPLHRLSEAVSRVSEKDFRLQLGDARLPAELRPIVDRLNQTLELLKRAFAREKQAAADISHELRTPLAALLTTTEVALRKPRSPEEYRELLADCRESGKQMSQLVERMLALARLDAGADTLRPREVDVANLAEQCAALVRPLAEARGLRLTVHPSGPAPLTADPDKLREVVTNLLHNAIQYNRPEGAIDLVVERDNGDLRLEVRDTGIGIAPAAREHIFERFFRADPSRQADGLHAGLGLAIVKGYVDLMGGKIAVESVEGQGSTFRVRLPENSSGPRSEVRGQRSEARGQRSEVNG
jgi:heavy metal sensor kinase